MNECSCSLFCCLKRKVKEPIRMLKGRWYVHDKQVNDRTGVPSWRHIFGRGGAWNSIQSNYRNFWAGSLKRFWIRSKKTNAYESRKTNKPCGILCTEGRRWCGRLHLCLDMQKSTWCCQVLFVHGLMPLYASDFTSFKSTCANINAFRFAVN